MKLLVFIVLMFCFSHSFALEDTPGNRKAAAEKYMEVASTDAMMKDVVDGMSMNMPPEKRDEFRSFMLEYVDYSVIDQSIKAAMMRHFTAEELEALTDFYSRPVAESAMKKFGLYMANVMPVIEAEMMRAVGQLQKAKAEENRKKPDPSSSE